MGGPRIRRLTPPVVRLTKKKWPSHASGNNFNLGVTRQMATHELTATYYLELASTIIRDHRGAVELVLPLLAGITDSNGDPRIAALRKTVLKRFYCETEDCDSHFNEFIGDARDEATPSSSTS